MTPEQNKAALDSIFDGTSLQIILCNDAPSSFSFAPADVVTATDSIETANDFVAGSRVTFATTGTLPEPLELSTVYWVINPSPTAFQVSASFGGSAVALTSQGTGDHTVNEVSQRDIVFGGVPYPVRSVADAVRVEIGDYEGQSIRPTLTGGAALITADPINGNPDTAVTVLSVSIDNSTGLEAIEFDFAYAITGGTTAPGNATGTLIDSYPLASTATIPAGVANTVVLRTIGRFNNTL